MITTTSGRSQASKKLLAPVLLIAALIFPLVTAQAQRARQKQRRAVRQTQSAKAQEQKSQEGKNKVTVVRRVNQARLSAATIRTLSSTAYLRGVFTVRANTISPRPGSSLWLLSNGGYALIGGGTAEPRPSETWTKDMGGGDVYACSCACENVGSGDDGCEFVGAGDTQYNPQNCRQTGGVNCTCKFRDGVTLADGTPITFQGPM
jgi:hypothetical protein